MLIPVFAVVTAIIAAVADSSSGADLVLCGLAAAPLLVWPYVGGVPLLALSLAVIVPAVVAQRSGQLEPLLFEVSLLAFVIGRFGLMAHRIRGAGCAGAARARGRDRDPGSVRDLDGDLDPRHRLPVGLRPRGRTPGPSSSPSSQATRRELAQQALLVERRRIARDVHDFVGHGLAAVMLQITSARHVLHRDPAAAEEALRSAEEVGRRSMRELRRTVALLRSDDEARRGATGSIGERDPRARRGCAGRRSRGRAAAAGRPLSRSPPGVGVALYRIAQEALANAARHAPRARTVLELDVGDGRARLTAETIGPTAAAPAGEPERAPLRAGRDA